MSKRKKIIYWVSTLWLALGMISTGIVQLIQMEEAVQSFQDLEYPTYLMPWLGILKIFGIIILLIPRFTLVKEWAYSGFFFLMTGAIYSHMANGDPWSNSFGPTLLLLLIIVSWLSRPKDRKINLQHNLLSLH